jgi:hypothetical protein
MPAYFTKPKKYQLVISVKDDPCDREGLGIGREKTSESQGDWRSRRATAQDAAISDTDWLRGLPRHSSVPPVVNYPLNIQRLGLTSHFIRTDCEPSTRRNTHRQAASRKGSGVYSARGFRAGAAGQSQLSLSRGPVRTCG